MNTTDRSRFDVDALRALAGGTVFARGEAYHRDGRVEILANDRDRVLARVAGSELYRTVVRGAGAHVDGDCNCPAFEGWGFCKHMVAVALAANERREGAAQAGDALARIRNYLKAKDVDILVEMLVDCAERDPALFDRLELATATTDGDDETVEARLLRAIDRATHTGDFVDYHEAGGWATGVEDALDAVREVARSGNAGVALKLVEHALDEIEEAIESIDDSDGHCTALLHRAAEIHLEACRATGPDPIGLAEDLFERELNGDFDTFSGAAARYADVLGEAGLAEYRRLATDAWAKLPVRVGRSDFSGDYDRLMNILDFFTGRDGDTEARIDIRAKDLSSPHRYLGLAQFCLAHGRADEALRRAEEGLWVFEDEPPDEPLVSFVVELQKKAGRKEDAEALLWRAFERSPSLGLYEKLRKICGKQALARARAHIEVRIKEGKPIRWATPAELLIDLLMKEQKFDDAWTAARQYGVSIYKMESLAKASQATHPAAAIEVYTERVEERVRSGGNHAYEEAARLVARMSGLRSEHEQVAYVADLRARHQRKRNFIKLLG